MINKLQWNIDNRAPDRWRKLKKSVNSPNSIYLFIASNWNTRARNEICSKLTKKTLERRHYIINLFQKLLQRNFTKTSLRNLCLRQTHKQYQNVTETDQWFMDSSDKSTKYQNKSLFTSFGSLQRPTGWYEGGFLFLQKLWQATKLNDLDRSIIQWIQGIWIIFKKMLEYQITT